MPLFLHPRTAASRSGRRCARGSVRTRCHRQPAVGTRGALSGCGLGAAPALSGGGRGPHSPSQAGPALPGAAWRRPYVPAGGAGPTWWLPGGHPAPGPSGPDGQVSLPDFNLQPCWALPSGPERPFVVLRLSPCCLAGSMPARCRHGAGMVRSGEVQRPLPSRRPTSSPVACGLACGPVPWQRPGSLRLAAARRPRGATVAGAAGGAPSLPRDAVFFSSN